MSFSLTRAPFFNQRRPMEAFGKFCTSHRLFFRYRNHHQRRQRPRTDRFPFPWSSARGSLTMVKISAGTWILGTWPAGCWTWSFLIEVRTYDGARGHLVRAPVVTWAGLHAKQPFAIAVMITHRPSTCQRASEARTGGLGAAPPGATRPSHALFPVPLFAGSARPPRCQRTNSPSGRPREHQAVFA